MITRLYAVSKGSSDVYSGHVIRGLNRQVLRDWWESHWSAQDTNKHSRPHAYPTGSHTGHRPRSLYDLLPAPKPAYRRPDCVRCPHRGTNVPVCWSLAPSRVAARPVLPSGLCGRHLEQLTRSSRLRATAATVPLVFMMIEESCTLLSTGTVRIWSTCRPHDSPLMAFPATGRMTRARVRVGSHRRPRRGLSAACELYWQGKTPLCKV